MDVEIRPITAGEFEDYTRAVSLSFGMQPQAEEVDVWRLVSEPERSLAAFEAGKIVGTAAAFSLTLTVPGGQVPMAGVTAVGVAPTHRRKGLLTALMRRQMDDYRSGPEPIAGLWASEGAIYQRFGYGLAAYEVGIEIDRNRSAFAKPYEATGRVNVLGKADALERFPAIYDRILPVQPGMVARTPAWWQEIYADLERSRGGASPLFFAIYTSDEGFEDGYIAYRIKHSWPEQGPSILRIRELMATTPDAYAALWRFALDHDLMTKIEAWPRQADEPLLHMFAYPSALNLKLADGLWVRLVDVPAALAARRYSSEGRLAVQVRDSFCPWNEGCYEVVGGPDGAECAATDRRGELLLDSRDLGAAYLGGVRLRTLARAGRVVELVPGALERADAMFTWDPPPWCPQVF